MIEKINVKNTILQVLILAINLNVSSLRKKYS